MDQDKKDLGKWWVWILLLILITVGVFAALKPAGMWWERQVMLQSHQYKEARATENMTFKVQLAEIEQRLITEIDESIRNNLLAQQAMLRAKASISTQRSLQ